MVRDAFTVSVHYFDDRNRPVCGHCLDGAAQNLQFMAFRVDLDERHALDTKGIQRFELNLLFNVLICVRAVAFLQAGPSCERYVVFQGDKEGGLTFCRRKTADFELDVSTACRLQINRDILVCFKRIDTPEYARHSVRPKSAIRANIYSGAFGDRARDVFEVAEFRLNFSREAAHPVSEPQSLPRRYQRVYDLS